MNIFIGMAGLVSVFVAGLTMVPVISHYTSLPEEAYQNQQGKMWTKIIVLATVMLVGILVFPVVFIP